MTEAPVSPAERLLAEVLKLYRETASAQDPLERLAEWDSWADRTSQLFEALSRD